MREQIAESKMHALDYWQVIRNRWGVILLTFFLVALASLVIVALLDKKYVGRTSIEVKQSSKGSIFAPTGIDSPFDRTGSFIETQFKVITAPETLLRVVERLNLKSRWNVSEQDALDKLERMVEPEEERGTEMITIEVYSVDPAEAAEIANAVRVAYEERRKETEKERVRGIVGTLEGKLKQQDEVVEVARIDMLEKMRQFGIVDMNLGSGPRGGGAIYSANDGLFGSMLQDQREMNLKVTTMKSTLNGLKGLTGDELINGAAALGVEDATITSFYPEYNKSRIEMEKLTSGGFGPRHPKVEGLAKGITQTRNILTAAAENYRKTLDVNIKNLEDTLAKVGKMTDAQEANTVTDKQNQTQYQMAKNRHEMELDLLNQMRETFLKTQVDELMPRTPIAVHEIAKPNPASARPNVPLLLSIGAGLGLILGLVLAFFLEYLDTSVKTLDDVERYLGVPVLAVIPKDVGVLHKQSGLSPDAEAYRILRTNIEFNRKSADANAITVVSGGAGEGKSTTLVNLAYICAQGGYNTLMIDGDLRRPKLHTFFDINNSVGLTNYLTTALMLEDVILQTPIENLYFMPSGILPADAAGILNSRRMSELIADVKNRFDLVLIDSPPILGVSDASVLASEVDLTMIVIQHRKLPRNMLMRVKQAIENVGGNLLGVVLNNVDVRSDSQYQYYTSYYTYYSPTNMEKPRQRPVGVAGATAPAPRTAAAPQRKGEEEDY